MKFSRRNQSHFALHLDPRHRRLQHPSTGRTELLSDRQGRNCSRAPRVDDRFLQRIVVVQAVRQSSIGQDRIGCRPFPGSTDQAAFLRSPEDRRHFKDHLPEVHGGGRQGISHSVEQKELRLLNHLRRNRLKAEIEKKMRYRFRVRLHLRLLGLRSLVFLPASVLPPATALINGSMLLMRSKLPTDSIASSMFLRERTSRAQSRNFSPISAQLIGFKGCPLATSALPSLVL